MHCPTVVGIPAASCMLLAVDFVIIISIIHRVERFCADHCGTAGDGGYTK